MKYHKYKPQSIDTVKAFAVHIHEELLEEWLKTGREALTGEKRT